ncbi:unnamed protein product [Chrysoparadoxa australica]
MAELAQAPELSLIELLKKGQEQCRAVTSQKRPVACWSKPNPDLGVALTVLEAAANSIENGSTRLTLLYQNSTDAGSRASVVEEMKGFCEHLISSLFVVTNAGATDSLRRFASFGIQSILHSLLELVNELRTGSEERLASLTGAVWEACKATARSTPKSNKLAYRRELMEWSLGVKDMVDEFAQAVEESQALQEADNEAGSSTSTEDLQHQLGGIQLQDSEEFSLEDVCDLGEALDDEKFLPEECEVALAVIDLFKTVRGCIKVANDAMNASPVEEQQVKRLLDWVQGVLPPLRDMKECSVELGSELYTMVPTALEQQVKALERCNERFLNAFTLGTGEAAATEQMAVTAAGIRERVQPKMARANAAIKSLPQR